MSTKRKLPFYKRLLFALLVALVVLIVLELGTRIGMAVFRPEINLADLLDFQRGVAESTMENRRHSHPEVIHPYVGFVIDPTDDKQFNEYGFFQVDGPILKRSPGTLIVGITGGSVAKDVCERSHRVLKDHLRAAFPDLESKIVCLAQQGFRQPQQAMTLSFFQCLGAEFDYVVALDGFNEAVLQSAEAPQDELWLAYPRNWNLRLADTANPRFNQLLHEGQAMKTKRQALAVRFQSLKHLPSLPLHLAWSVMDGRYVAAELELTMALQSEQSSLEIRYANRGPAAHFASDDQRFTAQAELWSACSRQLDGLCKGTNASFIHCLQPNMYVHGSKKMLTNNEARLAKMGSRYQAPVIAGYDFFVDMGVRLKESGIDFHDLRMLFEDSTEEIYFDNCCHFTEYGNDLLAASIAQVIASRHHRRSE